MEKFEELKKAAQPVKEFLKKHYSPKCRVVITTDSVVLLSTEMQAPFWDKVFYNRSAKSERIALENQDE